MELRINPYKAAPKAYQAMSALQARTESCELEPSLLELVKIRASQINGCAYCPDMQMKDARALGETEQRMYVLNAWRESSFYSGRERAALEWTEAVTLISEGHVPDDTYARAIKQFQPEELVDLTVAIAMINGWNRLGVAFQAKPGSYQSHRQPTKAQA